MNKKEVLFFISEIRRAIKELGLFTVIFRSICIIISDIWDFFKFPEDYKLPDNIINLMKKSEYDRAIKGYSLLVEDAIISGKNEVRFLGCNDHRLHEERVIALNKIAFELEKKGWYVLKNIGIPLKMKWRKDRQWRWYENLWYLL